MNKVPERSIPEDPRSALPRGRSTPKAPVDGGGPGPVRPQAPESEPKRSRSKWLRGLKIGFFSILGLGAIGALAGVVWVARLSRDLPNVGELKDGYAPPETTRILSRDGSLLGEIFVERRTVIPFEEVPPHVKAAFLAAEDARFYEHGGLNYLGLLRAIVTNLRAGRLRQGGSTITQQVVKNVLLDSSRSLERKVKETILAYELESELTKDQILGMYLNHIYLGHGRYGVEEAARYYFGKHARELDLAEAALLAGIVASPEHYSPRKSESSSRVRRHFVLSQMSEKGFVTAELVKVADEAPIRLAPATESESDLAPEFVEQARKSLSEVAPEFSRSGGYTIETTLDGDLQIAARKAVRTGLDRYLKRQRIQVPLTAPKRRVWEKKTGELRRHGIERGAVTGCDDAKNEIYVDVRGHAGVVPMAREERYNPTKLAACSFAEKGAELRVRLLDEPASATAEHPMRLRLELGPQAALIALDVRTNEIVAAIGSYEALSGGLDRSVQSRRQPGSSFKPLLYSFALYSKKFTLGSVFEFPDQTGKTNEDGSPFIERFSLRRGVAKSDNRVAEQVIEAVGAEEVVRWAQSFGIRSKLGATKSLALGAYEVTPLEMAGAYSVFASGGSYSDPFYVSRITKSGQEIVLPARAPRRTVIDADLASLTTSMLESVVESGTATQAKSLRRAVAGKTGTTNEARDAWFVGYSPEYVVAVWVGYDDTLPLGPGESGAVTALPIWIDFMQKAHEGKPATEFPKHSGLVSVSIDPDTGLLARPEQENAITEWYLAGSEPKEQAPVDVPPVPLPEGESAAETGAAETGKPEPPPPPVDLPPF